MTLKCPSTVGLAHPQTLCSAVLIQRAIFTQAQPHNNYMFTIWHSQPAYEELLENSMPFHNITIREHMA